MIETEVKIRIGDPREARERLLRLGAEVERERFLEENAFYDFPAGTLAAARSGLRLRRIGRQATLTFKGAPEKSRSFKVREEHETGVRDFGETRKLLRGLGLRVTFAYAKHRTWLRKGKLKICLDETAAGNFLELEGKRSDIVRFARALGYRRKDFEVKDYVTLLKSREGADSQIGLPPGTPLLERGGANRK